MAGPIRVVGLGPAGLDRVRPDVRALLEEPVPLVVRTGRHPAVSELESARAIVACDDLYEAADSFDDVYESITARVMDLASTGPVTYAVPGSPRVGERSVTLIGAAAADAGIEVQVHDAESFLDAAFRALEFDPFDRGMQVLDAHRLPYPLLLHLPTFITQLDGPIALAFVHERLSRLLPDDAAITLLSDLGGAGEAVRTVALADLRESDTGLRVTLFVDVEPPGWPGLVQTNARLRRECPWDREQTHHSLAGHLLEEAYETLEAIEALPSAAPGGEVDAAGYIHLEEELGDLLLQVVFHATLAAEVEVFDVEEVAESIRRKLVRRHPHVFGDVEAETADRVRANWEALKQEEKGRDSVLDGVPDALPALTRAVRIQGKAAGVGFDWPDASGVFEKVTEELEEIRDAPDADAVRGEVGDLLFTVVNLARHLLVDPELALLGAVRRFEERFRRVEAGGPMAEATLEELDARWEKAKEEEAGS